MAILQGSKGEQLLLTTENKGKIKLFNKPSPQNEHNGSIRLEPMDAWAEILYENGKKQRKEFYYGNTYLSQSSRFVMYSNQVKSVTIYDYFGNKRQVIPGINLVNN